MRIRFLLLVLLISVPASAAPREMNLFLGAGKSPLNFHGHSVFKTITFDFADDASKFAEHMPLRWAPQRWWHNTDLGFSVSYHDIRQARSWFGYRYGDPNDSVRGESLYVFMRHHFRVASHTAQPFVDIGTGPI